MKIFLIGFMGSGKTHWGRLWSQHYAMAFFDLDELIEQELEKPIADIFEEEGETYFRNAESKILRTFGEHKNCIIACGGGTPCYNYNLHWMNEHGTTVYLSASPLTIYNRVNLEKQKRPLIKNLSEPELLLFIEKKLTEREPDYKQAKLILPVEAISLEILQKFIIQ